MVDMLLKLSLFYFIFITKWAMAQGTEKYNIHNNDNMKILINYINIILHYDLFHTL